jgi:hypothetical protein
VRQLNVSEIRYTNLLSLKNIARCDELGHRKIKGGAAAGKFRAVRLATVIDEAADYVETGRKAVETKATEQHKNIIDTGNITSVRNSSRKKTVKVWGVLLQQSASVRLGHVTTAHGVQTAHLLQKLIGRSTCAG